MKYRANTDYQFIEFLRSRLKKPLPGRDAHMKMVPLQDGKPFRPMEAPSNSKQSAVIALLSIDTQELLFTLRSSKLRKHSGQISFPGGRLDEGENFKEAALRETYEEVGIKPDKIEIIGELSQLYVPPSNSVIQPLLGITEQIEELTLNPDEVEEAFTVKLDILKHPNTKKWTEWNFGGAVSDVPYYDVHPEVPLWGATAIMLSEFLELIHEM